MSRLNDLEAEVRSGDVLLISTKEGIRLSLQVVSLIIAPEGEGSTKDTLYILPSSRRLNLSAYYSAQMDNDKHTDISLDLDKGEFYGSALVQSGGSHLKFNLPLHFVDYKILERVPRLPPRNFSSSPDSDLESYLPDGPND
jgi:hypothetical protein